MERSTQRRDELKKEVSYLSRIWIKRFVLIFLLTNHVAKVVHPIGCLMLMSRFYVCQITSYTWFMKCTQKILDIKARFAHKDTHMPCQTIHLSHGITIQVGLIDLPKFLLQLSIYYPYTSVFGGCFVRLLKWKRG